MLIVLYVSAYATLVTEHNFSGYVLFNLSLFVFHVISVNVDFVIFCKFHSNFSWTFLTKGERCRPQHRELRALLFSISVCVL